ESSKSGELEFVIGLRSPAALERYPADSDHRRRLERRMGEPTVWDAFLRFLAAAGHAVPRELLARDVSSPITESPALHPVLVDLYRNDAMASTLCDRLVALRHRLMEWAYRAV